jgi:choline kinase
VRAVILAAGDGGRLSHHTAQMPKPLIPVSGRPLVAYTLEALADAGIEETVVVTGYREAQLHAAIGDTRQPRLTFVSNPRFEGGASLSLRAARPLVGSEPFFLLMADHMLSAGIISALFDRYRPGGPSLIATDASPWPADYVDEATRVRFAPGSLNVEAIGKGLADWDALDTGAFLLTPAAWHAIDATPEDCELGVVFSELAGAAGLTGVDVSGESWYDVDTLEDLEAARRLVATGGGPP